MRKEYQVKGLPAPLSHYADAVSYNGVLYLSGVIGVDSANNVVAGGTLSQTRKIFENMQLIFDEVGGGVGFKDVLKVTVYMLDVNERSDINPVRKEFFGRYKPASTLIGVNKLALPDLRIEIEAIVAMG
jgi:enamine deaminase RidA (YjgF/YER057c/UK114 family)